MGDVYVFTTTRVRVPEFRDFVMQGGGHWFVYEVPVRQFSLTMTFQESGSLTRGDGCIYLYVHSDVPNVFADEAIEAVGGRAMSLVSICLGHGDDSQELAREFANTIIERWGGALYEEPEDYD